MDDSQGTSPDQNKPGAPELAPGVKPPSAPLVEDRVKGPIFRAQPSPEPVTNPQPTSVPVESSSVSFDDDDEDEAPDGPPLLDEHQARIEYLQGLRGKDRKKKRKGGASKIALVVFLIFIIAGGIGTSVYFMFHRSRPAPKQSLTVNHPQQQPSNDKQANTETQQDDSKNPTTAESKQYNSSKFSLTLKYPGDWTPEELADRLSFTSPVVQLTDASNKPISGRIMVAIRPKQAEPAELKGGKAVAVLASEKMKYTSPASGQRAETYFTYVQFAATSAKGGLDGIYITGSYGYQYAQTIKLTEIASINPLINVTFVSCADTACELASQKPLTISSTAWKTDTTNRAAVEAILQSISLN